MDGRSRRLGVASTDTEGMLVIRGNLMLCRSASSDTENGITAAGELGIDVTIR